MSSLRRVLGLLWLATIACLVGLVVVTHAARAIGLESFAIRGGSMEPAVDLGSLVITAPVEAGSIREGDIVTFRTRDADVVVTHRVVEVDDTEADVWLRTKGDANNDPDPVPIPLAAVMGRPVVTVPLLGFLVGMLANPAGLVSAGAYLLALTLALWLLEDPRERIRPTEPIRPVRAAGRGRVRDARPATG